MTIYPHHSPSSCLVILRVANIVSMDWVVLDLLKSTCPWWQWSSVSSLVLWNCLVDDCIHHYCHYWTLIHHEQFMLKFHEISICCYDRDQLPLPLGRRYLRPNVLWPRWRTMCCSIVGFHTQGFWMIHLWVISHILPDNPGWDVLGKCSYLDWCTVTFTPGSGAPNNSWWSPLQPLQSSATMACTMIGHHSTVI